MRHARSMQTIDATTAAATLEFDEAPEFKLVIAYDSFANGRCAMKFFEWLMEDFGKLFTFVPRFLRFEDLLWPDLQEEAAREAAEADMVVIAANQGGDSPLSTKECIRSWEANIRNNGCAFVALPSNCQGDDSCRTTVQSHLRQVARQNGMKFLCKQIHWPDKDVEFPIQIRRRSRTEGTWPMTDRAFRLPGGTMENMILRQGSKETSWNDSEGGHSSPGKAFSGVRTCT